MSPEPPWERPLGARPVDDGRTEFRVWAPRADSVAVRVGNFETGLQPAGGGVYEVVAPARAGDDYWFVLDGRRLPDPASRWQPHGLRGASRVLAPPEPEPFDPPALANLVVYELHIGTFTAEGTFAAAIAHLPELAELVRAAHDVGLAVILDVVYNHVGASGVRALEAFGPYFTGRYETPWGRAINCDDADCDPVREWVLQSAEGWIRDFGLDGLRLDAIHAIFDSSAEHIVAALARRVHGVNPRALMIAESGLNDPRVMRPHARGGYECDAAWCDDFHHALRTLLTGDRDGYYADFGGVWQLAKAFHRPHVHDGSYSPFRRRRFGAPADEVPVERFVVFSQNHDQVGNRAFGDRLPVAAQPLAAFCTLLSPFVAMLFMGEEYAEPAPFQFFSDHIDKRIANATREGRRSEFAAFAELSGEEVPDPQDVRTFERFKLTRHRDQAIAALYAELLKARAELPAGPADAIEFDQQAGWLRVRRGEFELVCNFSAAAATVPCQGTFVKLATHAESRVADGIVELPPRAGALIL